MLGAEVLDTHYMSERASNLARAVSRRRGLPAGQIAEAFLKQRDFRHIIAWSDRLGLPLALLLKLTRGRRDLIMFAQWTSRAKKAVFLRPLRADTHVRAMLYNSRSQMEDAAVRLGVPRAKLHHEPIPVDSRFWSPTGETVNDVICGVGVEGRDYPTLVEAVRGLDVKVELGIASPTIAGIAAARATGLGDGEVPANIRLSSPSMLELRSLYARSRFVVLPLLDRDYESGSTVVTEALSMGKAVIVTRTRGQRDLIRDREHGLQIPPNDPKALRMAIEHLTDHPEEAERMGRAGRALVEERHTLEKFVARIAALTLGSDPIGIDQHAARSI